MSIGYTAYAFYGVEANLPPNHEAHMWEWSEEAIPEGLSVVSAGAEGGQVFIVLSSTLRSWDVKYSDLPSQTKLPVRRDGEDSDELYALLKQGSLLEKTDANSEGWHFAGHIS